MDTLQQPRALIVMQDRSTLIAIVLAALAALAPFAIDTYLPVFPSIEGGLGVIALQRNVFQSLGEV